MRISSMLLIGKNLRKLRKVKKYNPSVKILDRLAAYYGVATRSLFDEQPDPS